MKTKINRDKAKDKIVERRYLFLRESEKLNLLESVFPSLEETDYIRGLIEDNDLPNLDEEVINLFESKEYLKLPISDSLKPIFIFLLKEELIGVTNEYLELHLNNRENQFIVEGSIEKKGKCPCCLHYSIEFGEDGFHDICPVCFWQNGGNGPNHMTLEEAQNNFKLYGAMSKSSLQFIDPEGKIKYSK